MGGLTGEVVPTPLVLGAGVGWNGFDEVGVGFGANTLLEDAAAFGVKAVPEGAVGFGENMVLIGPVEDGIFSEAKGLARGLSSVFSLRVFVGNGLTFFVVLGCVELLPSAAGLSTICLKMAEVLEAPFGVVEEVAFFSSLSWAS